MFRYPGEFTVLQNTDPGTLAVRQIAAHLDARAWNITRELQLGERGQLGRLRGVKVQGEAGTVGRGGQWRVARRDYLEWLGIPPEDHAHLGADGLPQLYRDTKVAAMLGLDITLLRTLIRQQRLPYVSVGRSRYLTHNQLALVRSWLAEARRE